MGEILEMRVCEMSTHLGLSVWYLHHTQHPGPEWPVGSPGLFQRNTEVNILLDLGWGSEWPLSWMKVKVKAPQSCPALCHPVDSTVHGINSPGQNTGVGSLSLLQGIFPIQGSNPGFPHCRWILYQLSHKGSPRILEWVAYLFSLGSSQPRN